MTQTDASSLEIVLRLAASAYLGRYTGVSRVHSESDLRLFFTWCAERDLAPLAAQRAQIELYVRWMQEVRRFKPSTLSRRMAVVTGFYRACVIDTVLEHSPAGRRAACGVVALPRIGLTSRARHGRRLPVISPRTDAHADLETFARSVVLVY
jgi:hypothetical protein